jgi:hypothetical protein
MDCPICRRLRREYGIESQVEAEATIRQRAGCFHVRLSIDTTRMLEEQVKTSRKRQATIADTLNRHLERDHQVA